VTSSFRQRYQRALAAFLADGGEAARQRAYELGREALAERAGFIDLLALHREILPQFPQADFSATLEFLNEAAAPLEMELRGYHEANLSLRELNQELERKVEERTASLRDAEALLRARAQRLEALAGLGRHALGNPDLNALLGEACQVLGRLLGAGAARVLRVQRDPELMLLVAGFGWESKELGTYSCRIARGSQAEFVLRQPDAVLVEDLGRESRFEPDPLLVRSGQLSSVEAGIRAERGAWGILGAHSPRPAHFAPESLGFVQALADVLSTAITRGSVERALRNAEEKFFQAQKIDALGRLAGGVAHDFNNLLTVINGTSEMALAQPGLSEPLSEALRDIAAAGKRAGSLTRQLLSFSRKQDLSPALVDLNALVSGMEAMLRRLMPESIEWRWKAGEGLGQVLADPVKLEQVVLNLVINAAEAMPAGGSISLETGMLAPQDSPLVPGLGQGAFVTLAVRDTGEGMDPATRQRLFEPFFTTKQKGTGLGLATAYGIVKQFGGHILVESEPGRGSCFKIYLPLAEAGPAARPAGDSAAPARGHERVLVVEDDELVLRITRSLLVSDGYRVLEARSPAAALSLADGPGERPSLLVTDMVMPGMGGEKLSLLLAEKWPGLKVLFLSGYALNALQAQGHLLGKADFLEKPYQASEFSAKVRELLDRGEAP
jgi:two-component system cell cycle sensor histidine kinase/response regulator CckA